MWNFIIGLIAFIVVCLLIISTLEKVIKEAIIKAIKELRNQGKL